VLIILVFAATGHAQQYPSKPIRFVVGFTAGGASDITSRIVGQKLTEHLGQPVVIDNRAGASGTIAGTIVARALPDGYTLLSGATSILSINPALFAKLDYDSLRDFTPVSQTVSMPQLLVVHPSVKASTLKELLALAKARPGELNYSSSGTGSSSHLAMELLKYMTGINVVHVPFKGSGQAMPNLLAGQVQLVFDPMPSSLPHVKSGRLRAIAISTATRSPAIPELPTVGESGVPGYDSNLWYGVLLPARAPPAIVAKLNHTINTILRDPEVAERFAALGAEPRGSSGAEFGQYIAAETAKWGKVIKAVGLRAD
ncbi:MAG TPA: tripartite tricarboxylate transporter substrate binding protein, partial [Burkholderiales bacterium]|nr:tripartite tricarboxylate transporter substrate binding protein [Burkholderiales bacterium]